jgi:predicted Zn-dependent protease
LLALTVGVIVVAVPTAYFWYKRQVRATANGLLTRAEQLQNEKKWALSTAYYERYLQLKPEDTQALLQLVEVVANGQDSREGPNRFTNLLYRAIGRAPERPELHRMLAENLFKLGSFEDAQKEAKWLLENAPQEIIAAKRITALSLSKRARLRDGVSIEEAIRNLLSATKGSPGDVELVEVAANMLRQYPTAIELKGANAETMADQLMDRLVATDPQNVHARLTRYRYRVRNKLPDDAGDLRIALEIEPKNVDAILELALSTDAEEPTDDKRRDAEVLLRRAIEAAPHDPRAYLFLARILLGQSNKSDEVLELLQRARKATGDHFEICLECANIQIGANKLDAARKTLQELDSKLPKYLVQQDSDARSRLESRMRLLRAKLDLAQGKPGPAVSGLHEILLTLESKPGHQSLPEWQDACRLLAFFHTRSGQPDKASEHWGKLARALPGDAAIARYAVDSYLNEGNAKAAIDTAEQFQRRAEPDSELLVQLTKAHLALQLNRSHDDRSWSEFERALKAAKLAAPNRAELVFAEVNFLVASANNTEAAIDLLSASEQKFESDIAFWRTAAQMYQEFRQYEGMERALAKHESLASAGDHAVLQATLLLNEGKVPELEQLLAKVRQSLNLEERQRIEKMLVGLLATNNDFPKAFRRVQRLVEAHPKDTSLLMFGIDVAIPAGEMQAAKEWEATLRELTDNGPDAKYLHALRLIHSYNLLERSEKHELGSLISELRADRPKWYPAATLGAQYAHLQGDWRRALADYRLAIDLGDRRATTLQQLVTLLFKHGRFDEAQKYLAYFPVSRASDRFFDDMAVELAVKQEDSTAALAAAKQSAERFPTDPMRQITLANVLLRYGKSDEGLKVLRAGARKFPQDTRVWLAFFSGCVQAGKADEAEKTLAALMKSSLLPEEQRYFVAAQGHEVLGNIDGAKKLYQLAIDRYPNETAIRLKYAKLLSSSDPKTARTQYEHVLEYEPSNGEARRELSVLLAASGLEEDWLRVQGLLESASGESVRDARTNDRLRAMLLARKGRTRTERISNCRAARDMLQQLIGTDTAEADDLNRILISQILEQEAKLSGDPSLLYAARDQLRAIANRAPTAELLSIYIEFLLRNGEGQSANKTTQSGTGLAGFDISEQREAFLSEAEARIGHLDQFRSTGNAGLEVLSIAYQARLLQARGRVAEAKARIADFVSRQTQTGQDSNARVQRYLTFGKLYMSIGAYAEAESWYRRMIDISPNGYVPVVQTLLAQEKRRDAIELCLRLANRKPTAEMATLIASLMTSTDEPIDEIPEARAAIDAAIKDHSENIELLHAEAVRRASLGQYEDAVAVFRRILAKDSDNVLALNNFATVLAERQNQRGEALEHITRAIEIAGRQPSLLDTQGTILLKLGQTEEAIACLEEATAGGTTDARYYLHLAAAYQQAKRYKDAQRMLMESRAFGLEKFVLTADDRQLLASFDEQFKSLAPSSATQL